MEYRKSRDKEKQKGGGGKVITVLILIAAAVYFVSISAAGKWLSDNVVKPVISVFMTEDKAKKESEKQTSLTGSGEVTIPQMSCYCIQMGVFSTEENAENFADGIKGLGSGSYIYKDGDRYRVLAAGYGTEDEARQVKTALSDEGFDCSVHELRAEQSDYKVDVTGLSSSSISEMQTTFYTLLSAHDDLLSLETAFDKDSMTPQMGKEAAQKILASVSLIDKTALPEAVKKCVTVYENVLSELSHNDIEEAAAYSAMLKDAQIQAACGFIDMAKELTGETGF